MILGETEWIRARMEKVVVRRWWWARWERGTRVWWSGRSDLEVGWRKVWVVGSVVVWVEAGGFSCLLGFLGDGSAELRSLSRTVWRCSGGGALGRPPAP